MINSIISILAIIFFGLFAAGSCYAAFKEHAARKQAEKDLREIKENAENMADIITEANKTKADAHSGNHDNDFLYIANKLHDYANK